MTTQTFAIRLTEESLAHLTHEAENAGVDLNALVLDELVQLADALDVHERAGVATEIVGTELHITVASGEEASRA